MRSLHRLALVAAATALTSGAAILFGFVSAPGVEAVLEFCGVTLAAILVSAFAIPRSGANAGATMPPSFVLTFAVLLRFGGDAATLIAAASALTSGLVQWRLAHPFHRVIANVATVIATLVAALVYQTLGGTAGPFDWPWHAASIAAAVIAHCIVASASTELMLPMLAEQPIDRTWPKSLFGVAPGYVIGAAIAVGVVETIDRRAWAVLAAVALPLLLLFRAYWDHLTRCADEARRREVTESLREGMCVVDAGGRVILWNDALEQLVGCPRDQALGLPVEDAVPALAHADLQHALDAASASRSARTVVVSLPSAGGPRILDVKVLPVDGGLTLLWHDATARAHAERALRRHEERLTLAAEGANDGWWEWDLRRHELYVSSRWRAMLGSSAGAGIARPQEWTDRVHPEDIGLLREAIKAHLSGQTDCLHHECRMRHEDGSYRRFLCRGLVARGGDSRPVRVAGSLTDTTDAAVAQERLRTVELVDPLTGLRNRSVFVERVGHRLDDMRQRRTRGWFAVLYLDLDRFKVVNDSLGHLVGDELLIGVSRRLESCLRSGDALARLGGDEFAVLLNQLDTQEQANAIAFRIQEALSAPFSLNGREVFTSASIGIAFGVADYESPDDIMRDADTAMYHAKSRGKARHEVYDADLHARERTRLELENDLRRAINANDFEVNYQPIVLLTSGMCVGFESLVRWNRHGEAISPALFVPIVEELGLIEPLGTWVLHQACCTFANWQQRFPGLDCITVNASSRQLMQPNFTRVVEEAVEKAGLKPRDLRIEVTETALMDSPDVAAKVLRELRDFGVKIYLDDFGTGYSSLSHLHKLPVDALKIDRSFVKSLLLPDRPAIVESILSLARTLNTSVVAEGIETDVQARELERLGCTHAQGYLFSRPLSVRAAEEMLRTGLPLGPKRIERAAAEFDELSSVRSQPFARAV
jgi:diguanylate cyclase (GGDEF)-like protein/PAS domain S-box-containing protein